MTKDEYYSLKKGDIVRFSDTGEKCVVLHFDDGLGLRNHINTNKPNKSDCVGVIFINDHYRVIGAREEFDYIKRKKSE